MTPQMIANLACEWHEKNRNSIEGVVDHYATVSALTEAERREAHRLAQDRHTMRRPIVGCCK
jgi:hypothetical protein